MSRSNEELAVQNDLDELMSDPIGWVNRRNDNFHISLASDAELEPYTVDRAVFGFGAEYLNDTIYDWHVFRVDWTIEGTQVSQCFASGRVQYKSWDLPYTTSYLKRISTQQDMIETKNSFYGLKNRYLGEIAAPDIAATFVGWVRRNPVADYVTLPPIEL